MMVYITDLCDPVFYPQKVAAAVQGPHPVILITKDPSRLHLLLMGLRFDKSKLIVQATITLMGGSKWEPGVPNPDVSFEGVRKLLASGIKTAVRYDPMIPGVNTDEDHFVHFFEQLKGLNIMGVTTSVVDLYYHSKIRIEKAGLIVPFPGFHYAQKDLLLKKFKSVADRYGVPIRVCCEEGFSSGAGGCDWPDKIVDLSKMDKGCQRGCCGCPKYTQLITYTDLQTQACGFKCLYCYIKW